MSGAPSAAREGSASITTMTELVMPSHANQLGGVFGGQIVAWINLCGAICAQRHTGRTVTTAGIDELSFERPIKVGQVAKLTARVTAAFRTSLEILVRVDGEDARTGESWPCLTAFVTFVAIDDEMRPALVPPLAIRTPEEHALADAASGRRARRLQSRGRS